MGSLGTTVFRGARELLCFSHSNFPHQGQGPMSISEVSAAQGGRGKYGPPQRDQLRAETQKGWENRGGPTHSLRNFVNRFNGKEGLTVNQANLQLAEHWKYQKWKILWE